MISIASRYYKKCKKKSCLHNLLLEVFIFSLFLLYPYCIVPYFSFAVNKNISWSLITSRSLNCFSHISGRRRIRSLVLSLQNERPGFNLVRYEGKRDRLSGVLIPYSRWTTIMNGQGNPGQTAALYSVENYLLYAVKAFSSLSLLVIRLLIKRRMFQ